MDKEKKIYELLIEYPLLRSAFKAGLLSRRLCAQMIGITKGDMDDIYIDLIRYEAIKVLASGSFRALDSTMRVIERIDFELEQSARKKANAFD